MKDASVVAIGGLCAWFALTWVGGRLIDGDNNRSAGRAALISGWLILVGALCWLALDRSW